MLFSPVLSIHCFRPGLRLRKNLIKNFMPLHISSSHNSQVLILSHNSQVTLGDKRTTPPHPEIYPQNLSTQYLVIWASKKKQSREWGYSNFTKEETFLVSLKLSAIRGNVTLHHSCFQKRPLSSNLAKQRIYVGTYSKKSFWFILVPYPHRQSRKRVMNNLLLIISRCM